MTAVVGLIGEDGTIYMGGDSAGTNRLGDQSTFCNEKVFIPVHAPWFIMGVCGEFRFAQLLKYSFRPPPPPGPRSDVTQYIVTSFVDALRRCLHKAGALGQDRDGHDSGGTLLIGYQANLYKIEDNFQALSDFRPYAAIGSGSNIVQGAMYATISMPPQDRISLALEAAAHFSAEVRHPFVYGQLPFSHDWHERYRRGKKK